VVEQTPVDARGDAEESTRTSRRRGLAGALLAISALAIAIGVGPAGALDRVSGPWNGKGGDAATAPSADRPGRGPADEASCQAPAPATTSTTVATVPAGGSSLSQRITVVVPPIVRVQSDTDGELRIVTNAARPPAAGDLVYRLQGDGNYVPADPELVDRVLSSRWADGSWCSTTAEHRSVG
jgi:hypothetical protein